jgi:hypothetical protein
VPVRVVAATAGRAIVTLASGRRVLARVAVAMRPGRHRVRIRVPRAALPAAGAALTLRATLGGTVAERRVVLR